RLAEEPIQMKELAALLDGLSHEARVAWVRSVGRRDQRRLYEAAAGFLPLALADLVPPGCADEATVRHFGRNTLPAFTWFEKRFARPAGEAPRAPSVLHGFNFQTMSWLTGPGYYVARADPERPEVLIDYREVPSTAPPGWPPLRRNEVGLSRFVYGNMVDRLRRVSEHVTIGSAARNGRDLGSWFLLTRED
ncbi:MAG: hypothetical protein ABFS41_07860, partial [Myxococcota bacterium]